MTDPARARATPARRLAAAKRDAAALVLGIPFFGVVTAVFLSGWTVTAALLAYGVLAGSWVAWRAHGALSIRRSPEKAFAEKG